MVSIDANLLLFSFCEASPHHPAAKGFLLEMSGREDVALSEFVLSEVYLHLRNPAVLAKPLEPAAAIAVIHSYRHHPRWKILGFPPHSRDIHEELWKQASMPGFARRRIYDLRMALSLQGYGVREFATANVKDFENIGFARVWNPLVS